MDRIIIITVALLNASNVTPHQIFESDCVDSPMSLVFLPLTRRRSCQYAVNRIGCDDPEWGQDISTHCPLTCTEETGVDYCTPNQCVDSSATCLYSVPKASLQESTKAAYRTCSDLLADHVSGAMRDFICQDPAVLTTCRETCEYCGAPIVTDAPTVSPSLSPSEELILGSELILDFDDADLYYMDPLDDYDYGYDVGWDFTSEDIFIEGLGWYDAVFSPGSGFEYGIVSEPNASFNLYGLPVEFTCLNGAFSLNSMYLNSAWDNDCPVVFTATKNDGTVVTTTIALSSMTQPEFIEFDGFDDLQYLRMETPNSLDTFVMDDLNLTILSECFVPQVNALHLENHGVLLEMKSQTSTNSRLSWPIYPVQKSQLDKL